MATEQKNRTEQNNIEEIYREINGSVHNQAASPQQDNNEQQNVLSPASNSQNKIKSNRIKKEKLQTPAAKKSAPKKTLSKAAETALNEAEENSPVKNKKNKSTVVKKITQTLTKIIFQIKFHTEVGENIFITGNHELLGNNDVSKAVPLEYLDEETWVVTLDIDASTITKAGLVYNYILKHNDGLVVYDWGKKELNKSLFTCNEILVNDTWNYAGYFANAFYTEPFQNVLLKNSLIPVKIKTPKKVTHIFIIKAPLLKKGETVCLLGSAEETGNWNKENAVLLSREEGEDFYSVKLNLSKIDLPLSYKYGIYNADKKQFVRYENGTNRKLFHAHIAAKNKVTIANDGFIYLPADSWKGAGVSIPVFSLRSKNSWGVGEFNDLNLLVDWAKKTNLQLIQILPVNDTNATHSWVDSYPYAAISAFALHPMYLNLETLAGKKHKGLLEKFEAQRLELNKKDTVDYEAVNELKWTIIKQLYLLKQKETLQSAEYKKFLLHNRHWLVPYAVFCYLRDIYKTADFNAWPKHKTFVTEEVLELYNNEETHSNIALHCFVQFHLHLQLQAAAKYAHENGVIIKGDIPIGIYRYGADAWQQPELFHIDMQAGAPPDDFAITGQNWGFPTYNWKKMADDQFAWWKLRFEQMSNYFDAFRIDHILGFFRIWSIPMHSVEGIMGHFEPCIPVHINEFYERHIWFDYNRYCKPFINDAVLNDITGDQSFYFKQNFLISDGNVGYVLRDEFSTQRKVEEYFSLQEENDRNKWIKQKLFDLLSNIILFEAEGSEGQQFHFRFNVESTKSFQFLDYGTQQQLKDLYINYFFRRQDDFWMREAMQKLPALKRETNMLICGEDLGLVPATVPEVMKQLGLLSLEIQRMPKQLNLEFFHPNDAPYLSVVTPSTHDMSTIRGWWEEDRAKTQRFFNYVMGEWGNAPYFCEPWICKAIIMEHLYSGAMWSIFQWQDIMSMSETLRRQNPNEERINVPAISKYYWKYRMHLYLEDLLNEDAFNNELAGYILACGRAPGE